MNKVKSVCILGLLALPVFSAEVSVCIENQAYPPLINGTDTLPANNPGYSIKVAEVAAQRAGLQLTFIRRPWARCLQLVSQGKANALLPSIKTQERAELYRFPQHNELYLSKADYHIFYSVNDSNARFYESLAASQNKPNIVPPELKYGIAAPYGYIAYGMLKKLNLLSNHDYPLNQGLKMVANNKLDGYVVIKSIGEEKAQTLHLSQRIKPTLTPFLQEHLYVAFNKKYYKNNKNKIDEFWRQLPKSRYEILGY